MWNNIRIILLTLNPRKYVGIVKKVLYMHLTACEKKSQMKLKLILYIVF